MPFTLGEQAFEKSAPILKTKQMSAGGRLNLEKPAVCGQVGENRSETVLVEACHW